MQISEATQALGALAQDSRMQIFRLLVKAGRDGMTAGEIARAIGIPASTLSRHLAQLEQCELVWSVRQSRSILYRVGRTKVRELIGWLVEDCCDGRPELCGFDLMDEDADADDAG